MGPAARKGRTAPQAQEPVEPAAGLLGGPPAEPRPPARRRRACARRARSARREARLAAPRSVQSERWPRDACVGGRRLPPERPAGAPAAGEAAWGGPAERPGAEAAIAVGGATRAAAEDAARRVPDPTPDERPVAPSAAAQDGGLQAAAARAAAPVPVVLAVPDGRQVERWARRRSGGTPGSAAAAAAASRRPRRELRRATGVPRSRGVPRRGSGR